MLLDTKNNWIREYWKAIQSGKVVVSKKLYAVMQKLVLDLDCKDWEYHFEPRKAARVIYFIENFCRQSKGEWGGKPLKLELWQKAFVSALFGFVDGDYKRKYNEAWLFVARKNGKSSISSAIALYMLFADNEPGPEIYCTASKKDQAKIVWSEAVRMCRKSPDLMTDAKPLVGELQCISNEGTCKPLGRDSNTLDGLNVHCGIMDEVHAWTDLNMYDVIKDGTSAREQPLILGITTMGTVREGICDVKYDEISTNIQSIDKQGNCINEHTLAFVYELDTRDEWTNPEMWQKANPALGTIKKVDALEQKVEAAKHNSLLVRNLLCKDFNIPATGGEAYFEFEDVDNQATFEVEKLSPLPRYGFGGFDLSKTTDLTAAMVIFQNTPTSPIYVLPMFWLPENLLEKRSQEDKIPYNLWHDAGLLRTTPGNEINTDFVVQWFEEIRQKYDIYYTRIGYDAWSAKNAVDKLTDIYGEGVMEAVHQGKKTLSMPLQSLKAAFQSKKIIYGNNPILKWNLTNMAIDTDTNGNIQPCKGKDVRRRIDGAAALLDAYTVYLEHIEEYHSVI